MKKLHPILFTGIIFISLVLCHCDPEPSDEVTHQESVDSLFDTYDQEFIGYLANTVQATGKNTIVLTPLSDRFTTPKKMTIKGTPYDIGFTMGHIAGQFNHRPAQVSDNQRELNGQIADMYRRIYPQYLEIVRGVADSLNMDMEEISLQGMEYDFFVHLWYRLLKYDSFSHLTDFSRYGDIMPSVNNCAIASCDSGSHQIIGRNFDNPSDRPHYFLTSHMTGSHKMMGHAIYALYHWVVDGINEKGLSINCATNTEEYFWNESYPSEPAVFAGHMARIVMDTCGTVDEAIAVIGSVRVWFPNEGLHWVISDTSGKSVVVEFDLGRNMVVLDKPGHYELMTNTALQKGEEYVTGACWRYRTAKPMLENGIETMDQMFSVMNAIRPTTGGARTLWLSVMDADTRSFEVYYRKEFDHRYTFKLQ